MPRRRRTTAVAYPRDPATDERVAMVAEIAAARNRLEEDAARWRAWMAREADLRSAATTLALDDYAEIPFVKSVLGAGWYQYRARLRCGEGDCYAVAAPPIEGYEDYSREFLGLGRAHLLQLDGPPAAEISLAQRLVSEEAAFEDLATLLRQAGGGRGIRVHPYMGIEPVWELAEKLGRAIGGPVRVLGPLPRVTRLANDKGRFSEIVEALLGREALARTRVSSDPSLLAEHLREEAHCSRSVALKMPSCASGMGNRIFEGHALRGKPIATLRSLVDRFLEDKEWDGIEPVLVVEWHRDVLESPSSQCWIPPRDGGEPVVEEVFQQLLTGDEQVFQGAILSSLPRAHRHAFMVRSWLLCRLFQQIGYIGRCSFDALVVGPDLGRATVKFVECNGRWGGTSTPMHMMKRVFGDFRAIPYRGQGYRDERLRGMRFPDLVDLFDGELYDRRSGRGRILLYNVGGITEHGRFDMVITGRTYTEIDRFVARRIPALIDRYLACRKGFPTPGRHAGALGGRLFGQP